MKKTRYFVCEQCSGGCALVVEFPSSIGEVRIPEKCPYEETVGKKAIWKGK